MSNVRTGRSNEQFVTGALPSSSTVQCVDLNFFIIPALLTNWFSGQHFVSKVRIEEWKGRCMGVHLTSVQVFEVTMKEGKGLCC